ncbi:MAG: AAA family ATPase [Legionellales bacterium RIFCSPHIGHO2_12_FULL_42_9]|nr:MAG: AAA family ATPase [Legionellales bacterium RIFCSPHIGHO2_12_FULL_42_9]
MNISRRLNMMLPIGQSAFLWGARKTGKSTYLSEHYPEAVYYDLLKTDEYARLLASPHLLREELNAIDSSKMQFPVIIDEIQKIPQLLNEVHWLIEHKHIGFILCGSSARKLKRGAANLLGGRAWRFNFYPLIYKEIPNFDLLRALNQGLLPSHYLSDQFTRMLRAYVNDYLTEEIQAEGMVRNLPAFARFMELVGFTNGQMLNYANIARDCGVDAKTVKEYYQILNDTLIGYLIYPFHKKIKRELIQATPKFYLFDVGVANYLKRREIKLLKGDQAGEAFEQFILMELMAFHGLHELDLPIQYWRSKNGFEVDFILDNGQIAIEVKLSPTPDVSDIKGLRTYCDDYKPSYAIVVCQTTRKRVIECDNGVVISILPWQDFLENLWNGHYGMLQTQC